MAFEKISQLVNPKVNSSVNKELKSIEKQSLVQQAAQPATPPGPAVSQGLPAPAPQAPPPLDFSKEAKHKPKRGGLPVKLVIAIQNVYKTPEATGTTGNPQPASIALKPGWKGGQ